MKTEYTTILLQKQDVHYQENARFGTGKCQESLCTIALYSCIFTDYIVRHKVIHTTGQKDLVNVYRDAQEYNMMHRKREM